MSDECNCGHLRDEHDKRRGVFTECDHYCERGELGDPDDEGPCGCRRFHTECEGETAELCALECGCLVEAIE